MAVVNIMETIIEEKLELQLQDSDCCKCNDCKHDMLAYALNIIPPKYVNSAKGELFGRLNSTKLQNSVDIDIAIAKAISIVSASPNHKK